MKKIGIVISLLFAFLLIFGASNFLGTPAHAQAVSVRVDQDFVSNVPDTDSDIPEFASTVDIDNDVLITVVDAARDINGSGIDTIDADPDTSDATILGIQIENLVTEVIISINLGETGVDTGTFEGTFMVIDPAGSAGPGEIEGEEGDDFQITYTTLVGGRTITARTPDGNTAVILDATGPVIEEIDPADGGFSDDAIQVFSAEISDDTSSMGEEEADVEANVRIIVEGTVFEPFATDLTGGRWLVEVSVDVGAGESTVNWSIVARDIQGNPTRTDADPDGDVVCDNISTGVIGGEDLENLLDATTEGDGCQPLTVNVDSTDPVIDVDGNEEAGNAPLETGTVLDTDDDPAVLDRAADDLSRIHVPFSDPMDRDFLQAGDFRVLVDGNELNVTDIEWHDDEAQSVIIVLGSPMDPSDEPEIRVVNEVRNKAGGILTFDTEDAADGIAPSGDTTLTGTANDTGRIITNDDLEVNIVANEESKNLAQSGIRVQRVTSQIWDVIDDDDNVPVGYDVDDPGSLTAQCTVKRIVSKMEWECSHGFNDDGDNGLYNVFAAITDDKSPGNLGGVGLDPGDINLGTPIGLNLDSDDAVLVEVDFSVPDPIVTPGTGDDGTENPNAFVTLDFVYEGYEYGTDMGGAFTNTPTEIWDVANGKFFEEKGTGDLDSRASDLDTHDTVSLVSMTLDGNDVTDLVTVVNASPTKMFLKASGLTVGIHEIEVMVTDEAGNESDFAVFEFEVLERSPIDISLIPGTPNLVSLPGRPDNIDINAVIPPDVPVTAVFAFAPELPGQWLVAARSCAATCGDFQGNLQVIDGTRAIVLITDTSQPLSVLVQRFSGGAGAPGALPTPPPILSLVQGFNLVPIIDTVGGRTTIKATEYFAGAVDDIRKVYEFRAGEERFRVIPHGSDAVDADVVTVGTSVWVFVDAAEGITLVP